ncbi:hypothetical protein WAI453_004089 [Rhynchosporium graminicola]|uniref:SnoaL-like domain-containing protein n=1 Tax=Rhynchosporium graminicola TaxID=2792576 RepID=A0A1E1JY22_9HELO|nr:uncharacterized protein RCO7_06826 [Rhynchosporium commune]
MSNNAGRHEKHHGHGQEDPILQEKIPTFDDSRIRHFKDKKTLAAVKTYFKAFTTGKFDEIRDMESEDYTMTDVPIGAIRHPKGMWYGENKGFTGLLDDLRVDAISLYGSCKPGEFVILEHVVWFTLKIDPPKEAQIHVGKDLKKGDKAGMVNIAVLWWDEEGKICKELEYGRMTWPGFDVKDFDVKPSDAKHAEGSEN